MLQKVEGFDEAKKYKQMEHYNVAGLSIALIDKGQINMTAGFGVLLGRWSGLGRAI
ncbi:hypothetical protein QNH39_05705 [Neobacillus novalis]|uniref:Uncharacterized protein n=1 Tax=Neobacillus novalis TaxID=220687 RepID=A0AA95MU21_9BACI|nr:hypothetical protein [Neobacillus novalis]WHY87351.1 hypothetical protein QNH39_05705 [Neobacillus novalis]